MKLVPKWKECWKWISMHCMAYAAVIQLTWLQIPDDMKQYLPGKLVTAITLALLAMGIVGRLINQDKENVAITQAPVGNNSKVGGIS